jgi:hypothetical protein
MKDSFRDWQEISISRKAYKVNQYHTGMGIMEEDNDALGFRFKLISYTPGINKFGETGYERHRINDEQGEIFKVDLRDVF